MYRRDICADNGTGFSDGDGRVCRFGGGGDERSTLAQFRRSGHNGGGGR